MLKKLKKTRKDGKLSVSDIRYLALEGGGGKGFAHIGAIQALEELGLLPRSSVQAQPHPLTPNYLAGIDPTRRLIAEPIRGFAGSSIGAILALMLSSGYSADEIRKIMTRYDFDTWLEPPIPRYVPRILVDPNSVDPLGAIEKPAISPPAFQEIGHLRDTVLSTSTSLQQFLNGPLQRLIGFSQPILTTPPLPSSRPQQADPSVSLLPGPTDPLTDQQQRDVRTIIDEATMNSIFRLLLATKYTSGQTKKKPEVVRMLAQHYSSYLAFLSEDLGLFAGASARRFFAELLAYKLPLRDGKPWYNATFLDHYRQFGIMLVVTGTNFETRKSGVFSWKTTPNFPVADALRISMSMPLVFKPVVIRPEHYPRGYLPNWVEGVWVDGGYLDNIPLQIFDREDGPNPKTLGLRVGLEPPSRIEDILDFLTTWATFGVRGAGEAHINDGNLSAPQTILFDTDGLSTIDFSPDAAALDGAIERARQDTLRYFDERIIDV